MQASPLAARRSRARRIARVAAALAAGLLLACAGPLVVRAPQEPQPHPESVLGQIAPLAIAVPPAGGAAAAADPLGERAAGWGRPGGSIAMTERPGESELFERGRPERLDRTPCLAESIPRTGEGTIEQRLRLVGGIVEECLHGLELDRHRRQ